MAVIVKICEAGHTNRVYDESDLDVTQCERCGSPFDTDRYGDIVYRDLVNREVIPYDDVVRILAGKSRRFSRLPSSRVPLDPGAHASEDWGEPPPEKKALHQWEEPMESKSVNQDLGDWD